MLFKTSFMPLQLLAKQGIEVTACEELLRSALGSCFLEGPFVCTVGLPFGTQPV